LTPLEPPPSQRFLTPFPTLWRFDGEALEIDRLGPDGCYQLSAASQWLGVRAEEVVYLMTLYDDADDDNNSSTRVAAWARDFVGPRRGERRGPAAIG
jgi:hypothetical protein